MDFNEFKEQFIEDVKQGLADAGIEAKVSTNTVEKSENCNRGCDRRGNRRALG